MPFKRHSKAVTLRWARLSFPAIWEPKQVTIQGQPRGAARFSSLIIVLPEQVPEIQAIENELIAQSWPEGLPPGINLRRALILGEHRRPGDANLAGHWTLSANAAIDSPPQVCQQNPANPGMYIQLTAETGRDLVYSGCEAHVSVGIFTTQMKVNEPQIDVGLNIVMPTGRQFPRFDNRPTAQSAFGDGDFGNAPPAPDVAPGVAPPAQSPAGQEPTTEDILSQYGLG